MKNKIKTIWNKIDQKLSKHTTFILFNVILMVMFLFGIFAYCLAAFIINPYLGILTLIIGFGILAWFAD